jgi:hypothetical protein
MADQAGPNAADVAVSDRVEAALHRLLSEEVAELSRAGKGGPKCWPAVILTIAAGQPRTAGEPRHAVAHLIAQILDPRQAVPHERREAVAEFCRKIAAEARAVGLGPLHHAKKTARPFVEEVLARFGAERPGQQVGSSVGRQLTIRQLIARLEPHQPFEVQALAVKVLPDIVNLELRNAPRVVQERQQQLRTLDRAVGMVDATKYFASLTPKMRDACQSQMDDLRHRIARANRRP